MTGFAGLLPPKAGHCLMCAADHEPHLAHDAQSMFYQVRFKDKYGRFPTWADAVAHLPQKNQKQWLIETRKVYVKHDLEFHELPEGVEPIAEGYATTADRLGNPIIPLNMTPAEVFEDEANREDE